MSLSGRVLAIVPARGGSKGIPGKNLVFVAGKPLLVHTLEQALAAPSITRLVVSTDSPEIADVARCNGAEVVERPAELSGDEAPSESALLHCLQHLQATEEYVPDLVVFLQATSPLRRAADIEEAVATLRREEADSLFSACRQRGFVWRVGRENIRPLNYDPLHRPRRQDAPEDVIENGAVYVLKPWVLTELGCRLGGKISIYRMDSLSSLEVDEPGDLALVEMALQERTSSDRDAQERGR